MKGLKRNQKGSDESQEQLLLANTFGTGTSGFTDVGIVTIELMLAPVLLRSVPTAMLSPL